MNDQRKTKAQLIQELNDLRHQRAPVDGSGSPVDTTGRPSASAGDSALRIQAEERADIFRTISDNSVLGRAISDMDGIITYVNDYFASIHGYSVDEMIGKPFAICHTEEQLEAVMKVNQELMATGQFAFREIWHLHKDGALFPTLMSGVIVKDKSGKPTHMAATAVDITERKRAEALIVYQANLIQNVTDSIFATDLNFILTSWNKAAETMYGWKADEVLGESILDIISPEYLHQTREEVTGLLLSEGRWVGESIHKRKDGTSLYTNASVTILRDSAGESFGWVGITQDITERKQAEEQLRVEKDFTSALIKKLGVGLAAIDEDGQQILVNETLCTMSGFSEEELLGRTPPFSYWAEEGIADIEGVLQKALAGEEGEYELTFKRKTGERFIALVAPRILATDDGKTQFIATIQDITERKRAEQTLKQAKADLEKAQQVSKVGNWTWHIQKDQLGWSDEMFRIFGIEMDGFSGSLAEVISKSIHPDDIDKVEASTKAVMLENKPIPIEYRIILPDGTIKTLWAEAGELVVDENDNPIILTGIVQDITERKQAEEEREILIKDLEQKNAEMERFNYTVSHDLKSPLITITGFTDLLEKELVRTKKQDAALSALGHIRAAADKMHILLEDLLELTRVGRLVNEPEEFALGTLVDEVLEQLSGPITKRKVQVKVDPDLPTVLADRIRVFQVMQNLIENGIKFMDDQNSPQIKIGSREEGGEQIIYVQDNGIGIDPEQHNRIFDLFQQLQPSQEGSGVGLTLVKRIIELHGGRIWVESEGAGKGTAFCFTLPGKASA